MYVHILRWYMQSLHHSHHMHIALISTPSHSFLDLGLPLWLGGVPFTPGPSLPVSSQGITACIRDVYISGRLLDLNSHVDEQGTQHGCPQVLYIHHIKCVHVMCMYMYILHTSSSWMTSVPLVSVGLASVCPHGTHSCVSVHFL